jgi:tetratricopeptide (TPR) repeat protein
MIGMALLMNVAFAFDGDRALKLIQAGRYGHAVQMTSRELYRDPDDIDATTLLGVAWERKGHTADALGAFSLVGGGDLYEAIGLASHANALRAHGAPLAASALRHRYLVDETLSEGGHVPIYIGLAKDHLAMDDPRGAEMWGLAALSIYPNAPLVHAILAEIALYEGDLESADYHIFYGDMLGVTALGAAVASHRALLKGDIVGADRILDNARELRSVSLTIAALRIEVAHLLGEIEERDRLLNSPKWRNIETPDLLSIRARVAISQGDLRAGQSLLQRGHDLYPTNQEIAALLQRP